MKKFGSSTPSEVRASTNQGPKLLSNACRECGEKLKFYEKSAGICLKCEMKR